MARHTAAVRTIAFASIAAAGWFALVVQFGLMVMMKPLSLLGFAQAVLLFFSFFTLITNLLVAIATTSLAVRFSGFFAWPRVAAALATYITIVSLVYIFFLSDLWHPRGLAWVVDVLVHKVIPAAYVLAWLTLVPKGRLRWRDASDALILPAIYAVWIFSLGAVTKTYPYPFIDVTAIGYGRTILNIAVVCLAFLGVECVLIAIDRFIKPPRRSLEAEC